MKPVTREVLVERRQNTLRWSSIIGGVLVAIGAWMALQMIGLGAGLTAIDLDDASQSRGAGIGAGIWTVLVPLVAMFAGGYVASRLGRLFDREHAALHGAVLWAVASLVGMMFLSWSIDVVFYTSRNPDTLEAATDTAGKALLGAGVALLLGLGTAIGGAVLGARRRESRRYPRANTEHGVPAAPPPVDYGE